MKKNLSIAGFSLAAIGLFMGSCVSKRKYMEAQTSAAERFQADSAQWAGKSSTMQQNLSSMEQKNASYQKQMDSFRTSSTNYQKRWDNMESVYKQQNTSTEQLHQQVHSAVDQFVEASNVEARNGKVYVNLPEKMLFTTGSSTISTKGKQALNKLAELLTTNENVEVDIIASAAYYNNGSVGTGSVSDNTGLSKKSAADKKAASRNSTSGDDKMSKDDQSSASNAADSTNQETVTATTAKTQDAEKTTKATSKNIAKKSDGVTEKSSQGDRTMSFKSTPKATTLKATTAPSWNLNVARSTAIVRELTQNGLPQARIILAGQSGKGVTTNEWASSNKGYQIILSPKMDSYYQMMQDGKGSTSMK